MLRALEDEHFDQLPGGIFNKGFIRAYARYLHMDEDQVIAEYLAATGVIPPAKKPDGDDRTPILEPPPRQDNATAGLPWGTFAVVLLIVALAFAGWGFFSRQSQTSAPDSASAPANSPSVSPVAEQSAPEQKPVTAADSSAATSNPEQHPITTTPTPASSAPNPAPASTTGQAKPPVTPSKPIVVVVKAREDSWLSISVDGEIVTSSVLPAASQKSVRAEKQVVIKAGNVGALDFEFNGQKLPAQGDLGEVKTLTFGPYGLQPPAPQPQAPAQPR
jgi:cytoskeleton protein RodZ